MRDGSFVHNFNPLHHPIFNLNYQSKRLYEGSFGFGWCAEFEKTISISQGIKKVCNQTYRAQFKEKSNQLISLNPDGSKEIYNHRGQLISYIKPGSPRADLFYHQDRLTEIRIQKQSYQMSYQLTERKIKSINHLNGTVHFEYSSQNLVSAQKSKTKFLRFRYDQVHNLIQITNSSGRELFISYRSHLDEVDSVRSSHGCTENYQFQKVSNLELKSSLVQSCPSRRPVKKVYSFLARKTQKGLILSQIKTAGDLNDNSVLP